MQEFTLQEIDLSVLFRSVLKNYENLAQSKNLQFNFTCNEKSILIAGHEELLKRVFENLMDNAVKYTEKGSIHISVEKQQHDNEGFAVIGFKDTGIGIEKDKQEIIFQEFRQVSEGFGRSYEGTGLGLTLVLKIMKLMGGTITVNSTPGEGSLFSVWIPLVENGKDKKEEPKKFVAEPETSDGARKRLLLVEDNKINEEITVLFLQGKYDIESVNDGKKALAKASENEYDAFLLDIHLDDDMSGVDVAEGLRKMDKYKETPIVAITGYAMAGDREFLLSSGFTHYLAKPFQKEELLEVVGMVFKE
jgi:CheY-like chemotaxis protein